MHLRILLFFLIVPLSSTVQSAGAHPGQDAFVRALVDEHGLEAARVEKWLARGRFRQDIIDLMTRPAEAKPWHQYRPIFMTRKRIEDGVAFLHQHREALAATEARFGVPAEMVVAILGVETSYGGNTGRHLVLDALVTLGFYYPPRQAFFSRELGQLFVLAGEQDLDIASLNGSYAGAMGWGQFMPSSYRAYAKDGDGDGRIDLWNSKPDIFASIANYFRAHGWKDGEPVAVPAVVAADAVDLGRPGLEPALSVAELAASGYSSPALAEDDPRPVTLVRLEAEDGPEFWIAFRNFYVITRYNRSPLYAMAVFQLAQAIAEQAGTDESP
ncbi:MAG TPA: lytic murein transglycosylase B [Xanthomonadaceae bacterium]|nr:lytic murein transglycosylase B [Xanthomonadaceae bacterium]